MVATIFENIYAKKPHYKTVPAAAWTGSKTAIPKTSIEAIRRTIDKEKADALKAPVALGVLLRQVLQRA
jgi:hypothetical protein